MKTLTVNQARRKHRPRRGFAPRYKFRNQNGTCAGAEFEVNVRDQSFARPSPEGRGCREAAGEGYHMKILFGTPHPVLWTSFKSGQL